MKLLRLLFIVSFLVNCNCILANNISISNVSSVPGSGYIQLQFDLSWDNSWKNNANYDAAWVFFKFKDNDTTWRHLNLTGLNNEITSGYTISVPSDHTGAMIFRNVAGAGTVTLTGVKVGISNLPGSFDIKAFAIEMVQIPMNDQYYLGDGEAGTYYSAAVSGGAYLVNTSTPTLGTSAGNLNDGINNGTLNPSFPTAYSFLSFTNLYMMKHEISQGAYRDFLNTLSYVQQTKRTVLAPNSITGTSAMGGGVLARRNGIMIKTPGNAASSPQIPAVYGCNVNNNGVYDESNDGEWIACNYLTYQDLAAFLDWAALRPMTEMEFEKSCRGPLPPVVAENASGTVAAANYAYAFSNLNTANESVNNYTGSVLNANITYNVTAPGGNSPKRVGVHATPYATRISAGAGYYGALDLSGNIEEYTVTSGNNAGRSFTGVSGDGTLNVAGDADEDYWPGINNNNTSASANTVYTGTFGVTGQAGVITRGGSAGYTGFNLNKVSYRVDPGVTTSYPRNNISGGRGVKLF